MKRADELRKLGFDWAADLIETLQADKEKLQEAAKSEGKAISKMLESRAKSVRKEAERRKREMEAAAQKIAAKKPGKDWAMKIMADPKYFPAYSVSLARAALNEAD